MVGGGGAGAAARAAQGRDGDVVAVPGVEAVGEDPKAEEGDAGDEQGDSHMASGDTARGKYSTPLRPAP